jgi:hypothetical protein
MRSQCFSFELQIRLSSGTLGNVFRFIKQKAFKYGGTFEALSGILFLWIQFTVRANWIEHVDVASEQVKLLYKGNLLSVTVTHYTDRRNSNFIDFSSSGCKTADVVLLFHVPAQFSDLRQ